MIGSPLSLERPHRGTGRTPVRIGVLLGLTLLGACQSATARRTAPRFETAFSALGSTGNRPLVSLPNSGPVTAVTETQSSAGLRQRIVHGATRGRIDLTIASGRVWDDPAMERPSRAGIAAELASLEGGGAYRILHRPVHNAYGPLGVAVNERCAYAWQWIDGLDRVELGRGALRGPVAASIRVQHCRRQSTTAEALLADLTRMRLGPVQDVGAGIQRRRVASPKIQAPEPEAVEVATAVAPTVVPAPPVRTSPTVAVNGSRTLVTLPQASAAPQYLAPAAPAAAEPAIPTVPRPATTGGGTDRPRFLTDALPASPAAPAAARASNGSRPPQGW
ncbi:cellulose biosynthesis protein BcsN [Methylobacterium sp. Leaf118]|uniref:cellulose biosynthesis protein BcsN n=1 Tax=Methylobacterium sp. Leaf118 TaxID=2876562 RepID=UPI001E2AEFA9|nr:cellulose biosynthesis protein BcsN [Methylobacterium sp. Leaf118]